MYKKILVMMGVIVTYHLFETPIISSIELTGNTDIEPTSKLLGRMQLREGDRLNRLALKEDVRAIQKQYIKDGYIMAKIRDMEVGDDGKLVIKINEGILEGFKIKGLKKTKEKVVLRELRPKVGKPLNKNEVVRSYQRLTNLDFFESVDVKPIAGVEPNACVLEIDVTEKNTGVFGIGAGYYFIVDDEIMVADPCAKLILDPWNDKWINEGYTRYPDLKPFPTEKVGTFPIAVFQGNGDGYKWQVTDFKAPAKNDLIIYELLLRDFTKEQCLESAMEKLDYLVELGVNAIELMPIQEFDGNNSWGYNPNFYFAPDKYYGTSTMYKTFIDE